MQRDNQYIHPTAVVEPSVELGEDVRIWHFVHVMHGAVIGDGTSVGQGCYIAGKVRIGKGCKIQNHVSLYDGVTVEDEVFLGPSCVFTNVTHPRAHVVRKDSYARTLIHRGATVGANATIVCGVTIGEYAMIGAGAVITRDVLAHALVVGTPGRRIGWACRCGETLPEALACQRCGDVYREIAGALALRA
ncbi:MAG: N-acetyltransferase [Deltaproteobacteria bacterium]|nr:N-acetyltransferase [Deltaproteobacteria bacterium]